MSRLVSILMPAYNAERWISQSLESALAQTWPHKELVVIDDGSTDHTLQVAKRYESGRVKVVTQRNSGAAGARNAALALAQGDYIQWLDADDLLHPEKIERQLTGPTGEVGSRTLLTSSWGRFFTRPEGARFAPDALWETLPPVDWISRKFSDNAFMFPATWLVSRQLVEMAGPWDVRLSLDDDGEYMCRLVAASQRVRFVTDAICYYRIGNGSSLSAQRCDRAIRSGFASIRLCIRHLLTLEDSERTRKACLRLLQDNLPLFYPEHVDLVSGCFDLARSLGGELHLPRERPHFRLFRSVFGWHAAKRLRWKLNDTKLLVHKTMDRLAMLDVHPN